MVEDIEMIIELAVQTDVGTTINFDQLNGLHDNFDLFFLALGLIF
jgi:hypothetical protein